MERIEVNLETGEIKTIPLTDAEVAIAQAQYQAWLEAQSVNPPTPTLAQLQEKLQILTAEINKLAGAV